MEPFIGPSKADYSQENEMDTKVLHDKRLQVIMVTFIVSKTRSSQNYVRPRD